LVARPRERRLVKIALIGATGRIGGHLLREARERGHDVLALVRPGVATAGSPVPTHSVDIFQPAELAEALRGQNAVVSAYGVPTDALLHLLPAAAAAIVRAARLAGVRRVVTVGGAGMLHVSPGIRLADTPDFPAALQPKVVAHEQAVAALREATDLDRTCVAPAAQIGPGGRSGRYRVAVGALVRDAQGRSAISFEDFAIALLDELEQARHLREVIGVGA
jgi:putative NADH-flavin reductase